MTCKSVMVHLTPSSQTASRLRLATGLARRFEATLIGLATAEAAEPLGAPSIEAMVAALRREQLEAAIGNLRHSFFALATDAPSEWRSTIEGPIAFAAAQARAADLIVLGRPSGDETERDFRLSPGALLMMAGRPLLITPPEIDRLQLEHVVVAWKGGRHARTAVQQSLPVIAGAAGVTVLGVGDETDESELEDVCAYLARHGLKATPQWHGRGARAVADVIVDVAEGHGADLIVSGGYGHGRVMEWTFGGVTQDLLNDCPICCLMAH